MTFATQDARNRSKAINFERRVYTGKIYVRDDRCKNLTVKQRSSYHEEEGGGEKLFYGSHSLRNRVSKKIRAEERFLIKVNARYALFMLL